MPLFRLISTSHREALAVEFYDVDAAGAIDTARRARMVEADLWQEDQYLFTLSRSRSDQNLWTIFRKPRIYH